MIKAQKRSKATKTMVPVNFKGYTTVVDPALPLFTEEEIDTRYRRALKGLMASKIAKSNKIAVNISSEDDEVEELSQLSESILKPNRNEKEKVTI